VRAKRWVVPSEMVDDIEEGKEKATKIAQTYLKQTVNAELPALNWKKARSR